MRSALGLRAAAIALLTFSCATPDPNVLGNGHDENDGTDNGTPRITSLRIKPSSVIDSVALGKTKSIPFYVIASGTTASTSTSPRTRRGRAKAPSSATWEPTAC